MVDFEFREHYTIDDLRRIVAILRHPGGCPWDAEQTHESLRRCLMEECCEVLEAIDRRDDALLCEELGDVLLQVVFHTSLAEDTGRFDLDAVADGICKKMIFRHPHVFGSASADTTEEVLSNWDTLKREEKGIENDADALRAVARTLPALWRAEKVLKKAAKAVGEKSIAMLPSRDLLPLTGYVHGGCSPIGMKKQFPTFADATIADGETVCFSGGRVGLQIETTLAVLQSVVPVTLADLTV